MTQSQNYHRYFFNIDNKYRTQRTSLDQNYSKRFRSHSAELDGGTKISQGHEASAFTRRSSHGQYGLLVNVYYVYTKDFRKLSRLMKQIFQCRTPFMRENGLDILGKSSKFYLLSTKLEWFTSAVKLGVGVSFSPQCPNMPSISLIGAQVVAMAWSLLSQRRIFSG
ncbi:hypothetical protein PC115_g20997 [Phytophthora cactorum]|uniref:Uncharacterized protein n=1 Tax=Phytophthora cactorum TaxID=29920 RepID=A0A8T1ANK9_9STRA|nr:hypothetical protein PC115_g20997 [Phytophthora cactorum]